MSNKTMATMGGETRKCTRLISANKQLVAREREVREALRAVMAWWMATPQFEAGEDEMPAAIFDKTMKVLRGNGNDNEERTVAIAGSEEWPSKGLL